MNVLDIKVSYFKNIYDTTGAEYGHKNIGTIGSLLECIRNGGNGGWIGDYVSQLRQIPDKKARDARKVFLPVITWQGIFTNRCDEGLDVLSSLICIDIDHKTDDELAEIMKRLVTWAFVVAFFRSPSGDGLKVIIKTDLQHAEHYKNCYKQLEKMFYDTFGLAPDANCEPLSQGCFMSYDPGIYVNERVQDWRFEFDPAFEAQKDNEFAIISVKKEYIQQTPPSAYNLFMNHLKVTSNGLTDTQILNILDRKFSQFKQNYQDGHRTKSIFTQASILCKAGINEVDAVSYLATRFTPTGYDIAKLKHETNSAYMKNRHLFGSERGNYLNYNNYKNRKNNGI